MTALIIAEHNNTQIQSSTYAVINAGLQLNATIDVLVVGFHCQNIAESLAAVEGVSQVWYVDDAVYAHLLAENLVPVIQSLAEHYTHILAPANTFGKNFLPRLAAKLNVDQVGDVIQIVNENTFIRPIYAGNALTEVLCDEPIKLLTIRCTAFPNIVRRGARRAPVSDCATLGADKRRSPLQDTNAKIAFVRLEQHISSHPELTTARVVITGGRGLQSVENFKLLEKIAEPLQAAIGATRAAVDAGFVPNDYQVGQTGKVVAPELYIAVGVSGAIQHVAGMKDSKVIVAINKDADAPIFQIADYGLVGDLFTILPELEQLLINLKQ